jgi:hypothetical protein
MGSGFVVRTLSGRCTQFCVKVWSWPAGRNVDPVPGRVLALLSLAGGARQSPSFAVHGVCLMCGCCHCCPVHGRVWLTDCVGPVGCQGC